MGLFKGRPTVEESKFTALIWAMQASWSLGYTNLIFEGDNAIINNSIQNENFQPRFHFYLFTVSFWIIMFVNCRFQHTKRNNNRAADSLARKSFSLSTQWRLFHEFPQFLEAIVNNDND